MAIARKPLRNTDAVHPQDEAARRRQEEEFLKPEASAARRMKPRMFRMDDDLHGRIERAARSRGLTASAFIRMTMLAALRAEEE